MEATRVILEIVVLIFAISASVKASNRKDETKRLHVKNVELNKIIDPNYREEFK